MGVFVGARVGVEVEVGSSDSRIFSAGIFWQAMIAPTSRARTTTRIPGINGLDFLVVDG